MFNLTRCINRMTQSTHTTTAYGLWDEFVNSERQRSGFQNVNYTPSTVDWDGQLIVCGRRYSFR